MRRANPATPGILYDDRTGQYTREGAPNRFIKQRVVVDALHDYNTAKAKTAADKADQLIRGEITLKEFQLWGEREIAKVHLAANAAAKGGWAKQSQSDYGYVGSQVRQQLKDWRIYCIRLETGERQINGTVRNAARGIVHKSTATYHKTLSKELDKRGFDEVHNVQHSKEGCNGCNAETAKGWQKADEAVPPGEREPCGGACLCTQSWRNSVTGEVRE